MMQSSTSQHSAEHRRDTNAVDDDDDDNSGSLGIDALLDQKGLFSHPMHDLPDINFADPSYWRARYAVSGPEEVYDWYDIDVGHVYDRYLAPLLDSFFLLKNEEGNDSSSFSDEGSNRSNNSGANRAATSGTPSPLSISSPPSWLTWSVLLVGCGNSTWGVAIADRSRQHQQHHRSCHVVNSDFDALVCDSMRFMYPSHQWDGGVDACALAPYADGTLQCVLDKATFDALVVSHADRPADVTAALMAAAAYRVLCAPSPLSSASSVSPRRGGTWLIISNHPPSRMMRFFSSEDPPQRRIGSSAQAPQGVCAAAAASTAATVRNGDGIVRMAAQGGPSAVINNSSTAALRSDRFAFHWKNCFDEGVGHPPYVYEFEKVCV